MRVKIATFHYSTALFFKMSGPGPPSEPQRISAKGHLVGRPRDPEKAAENAAAKAQKAAEKSSKKEEAERQKEASQVASALKSNQNNNKRKATGEIEPEKKLGRPIDSEEVRADKLVVAEAKAEKEAQAQEAELIRIESERVAERAVYEARLDEEALVSINFYIFCLLGVSLILFYNGC